MKVSIVGSPFEAIASLTGGLNLEWKIVNRLTGEMVGWVKGGKTDARDKLRRMEKERIQDHAATS